MSLYELTLQYLGKACAAFNISLLNLTYKYAVKYAVMNVSAA